MKKLLSICIPTYNGGDKLGVCIGNLIELVKNHPEVEVIVSNNGSTDNTRQILSKYEDGRIRIYHNATNIGFSGNIKLLIDDYATGDYCWLIGDDDFLDIDTLDHLIPILEKHKYPYISIKHRCMTIDEYMERQETVRNRIDSFEGRYFQCLDRNAEITNILGTFMTSQIFRLETIKKFDKTGFAELIWDNFRGTFPNSYMMTESFHAEKCLCISTPLVTALVHPKDWDERLFGIKTEILPSYLKYCYTLDPKAWKDLQTTRDIVTKDATITTLRKWRQNKSLLLKNTLLNKDFYVVVLQYLCKKIRRVH